MKIIRKPPAIEVPKVEPEAPKVVEPDIAIEILARVAASTNAMVSSVSDSTRAIAEKLQEVVPAKADAKPTSFRCRITERDESGRIKTFEITKS